MMDVLQRHELPYMHRSKNPIDSNIFKRKSNKLDRDIVWNERENSSFFVKDFDSNQNVSFGLILNFQKKNTTLKLLIIFLFYLPM